MIICTLREVRKFVTDWCYVSQLDESFYWSNDNMRGSTGHNIFRIITDSAWMSLHDSWLKIILILEFCVKLNALPVSLCFTSKNSDSLVIFKVLLRDRSTGFLKLFHSISFWTLVVLHSFSVQSLNNWTCPEDFFFVWCLFLSHLTLAYKSVKHKKATNSTDEPVLCLHATDNLTKTILNCIFRHSVNLYPFA